MDNLPTPSTPLIDRDRELAAARERLLGADTRLLALTGPGGIGKTRLALEIGTRLGGSFADGVCFVSLAAVNDPLLVPSSLAGALGVQEAPGQPLLCTVKQALRDKSLLLILDSFDRVTAAAPLLADLLASCPGLEALLTSRALPRIDGGYQLEVPPLSLPARGIRTSADHLVGYGAVRLFLERAREAGARFAPNRQNLAAIVEICQRLDGLPLAIELAAARSPLLPPAVMLERLSTPGESPLRLLSDDDDTTGRQPTLRATIAWSYDLLAEAERVLFRRLAVFAGGCAPDATEAVCGPLVSSFRSGADQPEAREQRPETIDVSGALSSLSGKSLVRCEQVDGETRIWMLETIREFGLEQLVSHGEDEAVRERHADYFLSLAEAAEPRLLGAEQRIWLPRLDREHDNLRAALDWLVARGEAERAWRLGGSLWRFWVVRGHLREGRRWMTRLLELEGPPEAAAARARALNAAGNLAYNQGDNPAAEELHEQSLVLRRSLGDERGAAASLNNLALVARRRGDPEAATVLFEQALAINRRLGNRSWEAINLHNLGMVAHDREDFEAARALLEESLAIFNELDDEWGIAMALCSLGNVASDQGDDVAARALYDESLARRRGARNRRDMTSSLIGLAQVALRHGELFAARSHLTQALTISRELDDRQGVVQALEGFAALAAAQAQAALALRLAGAAAALRGTLRYPASVRDREALRRGLEPARRALGPDAADAALAEGRALLLVDAISAALAMPRPD